MVMRNMNRQTDGQGGFNSCILVCLPLKDHINANIRANGEIFMVLNILIN